MLSKKPVCAKAQVTHDPPSPQPRMLRSPGKVPPCCSVPPAKPISSTRPGTSRLGDGGFSMELSPGKSLDVWETKPRESFALGGTHRR